MLKHSTERVHRKVLRKVKKQFVTVTVVGGLVSAIGASQVSAAEEATNTDSVITPETEDDNSKDGDNTEQVADESANDDQGDSSEYEPSTESEVVSEGEETEEVSEETQEENQETEEENQERQVGTYSAASEDDDDEETTQRATIVHTNDIHGRIDFQGETEVDHGLAYIDAAVKHFEEESDEVLLLDAGDAIHGTTTVNQTEGQAMVDLLNALGYHAMASGNHEYNYGSEHLEYLNENELDFPIIAANVFDKESGDLLFDAFTEWEVFGKNIGIIGVATQDTYTTTHPSNVTNVEFTEPAEAVEDVIAQNANDFDHTIVLSHAGYQVDLDIAKKVDDIDLIIGGHSHTPIPGGVIENGTVITQAWEHGKTIGAVHLDFKNGKLDKITPELIAIPEVVNSDDFKFPAIAEGKEDQVRVLEGLTPTEDIQKQVTDVIAKVEGQLEANIVGETSVLLNGERDDVRRGSTNLGGLITDALRDYTDTDIAIINGGGIRASIQPGEISQLDVLTTLPFINLAEVQELPGSVILEALELGVSKYPEQNGGLLHTSGLTYLADGTKEPGKRIVSAEVDGQPLDPEKTYTVTTSDFFTAGGDGYTMLADHPVTLETGVLFSDIVMDFIAENGVEAYEDFEPRFEITDEPVEKEPVEETEKENDNDDSEETDENTASQVPTSEDPKDESTGIQKPILEETKANKANSKESISEEVKAEETDSKESTSKETKKDTDSKGQRLPDTATAAWSISLLGLITLAGGAVAGKFDKRD